jgi:hypothetical protein
MESILQNKNIKMSLDIGFYSNMPKVCMVHGKQIKYYFKLFASGKDHLSKEG